MSRGARAWERLRKAGSRIARELEFYRRLLRHPDTPRSARLLLAAAIGYLMLPFDLIPDFIPVLGHLDDAILVPGLVALALRRVPPSVIAECRQADSPQSCHGAFGVTRRG
jgi:uncharacterized membrane protein YkvA (DUF1232 family)